MKRKKILMLSGMILVAVILVASPFMVSFAKAAPPNAKTLKIGALISMTGFASASEVLIWEGIQLFEQWINEQGGITIKRQPYVIKFVAEDGQSSADGAVASATKLIYDHDVKFLVGHSHRTGQGNPCCPVQLRHTR